VIIKYKVKYIHEGRSCTNILDAYNFDVVRNTVVFYTKVNLATHAFNNVVSVEKMEEGDDK
jgi:hypothetical protein